MKKKTEAILKTIGVYLALNAGMFGLAYILSLLLHSSLGVWLEINRPSEPRVPGTWIVGQIIPLMLAFFYYRHKVHGK